MNEVEDFAKKFCSLLGGIIIGQGLMALAFWLDGISPYVWYHPALFLITGFLTVYLFGIKGYLIVTEPLATNHPKDEGEDKK